MRRKSPFSYYLVIAMTLLHALTLPAQRVVVGTVTDCQSGQPLRGANISLTGTGRGSVSQADGRFTLTIMTGERNRITISYVGYRDLPYTIAASEEDDTLILPVCLQPEIRQMSELFVTATRTPEESSEIPARIAVIPSAKISEMPSNNVDEVLQLVPGIKFDRDFGIFSKNSSVTMRGLNGSYRALILQDGIPLNKTDGGGINWNRLIQENIGRIEVLKGPVSAVYGSHAMSGVINVISRRPSAPFDGMVKALVGTYGTVGGLVKLGGCPFAEGRGLYYDLSLFYRQGNGYITEPEETRDTLDVNRYLKEGSVSGLIGYRFNDRNRTELEYTYYNDIRGDGTKIHEPMGGYNRYPTHLLRLSSHHGWRKWDLTANGFYQHENYLRQHETMSTKRSGKYTLYETDSKRVDWGLWMTLSRKTSGFQDIIIGMDLKQGRVDASDTYYTSSDILTNRGRLSFFALFTEYELHLWKGKFNLIAGLRWDVAWFTDGSFTISFPSSLSDFMTAYPSGFSDETWNAVSPKLGIRYNPGINQSVYISYAHGFRPPILDDMCRNGNISKGFKMANPQLQPEALDNVEAGASVTLLNRISLEPSVYLSFGRDFQYFVATGDSIYTGGDNLKPVMQRENISRVRIMGGEVTLTVPVIRNLSLIANYAYNYSRITRFDSEKNPEKDLTGKFLMEVPKNQAFAGIFFTPKWLNATLACRYVGAQWVDDENTMQSPGYITFDLKVSHTFFNRFTAGISVQDLFNRQWTDSKGQLSPGRYITISLASRFSGSNP